MAENGEDHWKGTLELIPVNAEQIHDHDSVGKQDPYCKITIGKKDHKTKTDKNAGLTPKWNDILVFKIDGEKEAYIKIKDKDLFGADLIAEASIDLVPFYQHGSGSLWVPLHLKNQKNEGKLRLEYRFKRS